MIQYEDNPIVGRPFKLECNTETTIVATVNIKSPDDTSIGSCVPAAPPFSATCSNAAGYEANLNESLHTLRINTSSMASDVNGTWVCLHDGKRATYVLASPLTGNFNLYHYSIFIFTKGFHRNDIALPVHKIQCCR